MPLLSVAVDASAQVVDVVVEELGKPSALDCRRAMSSDGVSVGLVASISAATPEAIGAAKLVPTLA